MEDLSRIRLIVALAWSVVLIVAGLAMLRLLDQGQLVVHVWQLFVIVPGLGGVLGLTVAWVRDELRESSSER